MLTVEENERLTRVGPGTPMGELLREFWTPALRSDSLEAGGAPQKVRLLGENFVAFRGPDGELGFLQEKCPHRSASLALARNEDGGLRCIFHGWKFSRDGRCIETPTEPAESRAQFCARVPIRHCPVREAGGMVWAYLGRRETPPKLFDFEFHRPPAAALIRRGIVHGNWLQGFEGQLDSAHIGMLHSSSTANTRQDYNRMNRFARANAAPRFETIDQPYGFREAALRDLGDGTTYARIREVVFPYYSFIPGDHGEPRLVVVVVPIDDEWSAHWYYYMNPFGPVPDWYREWAVERTTGDDDNYSADMGGAADMWKQDRAAMKAGHWSGILGNFTYEDFVIEESMGPISDRSQEFLGTSDAVIVRARRMLQKALREHAEGKLPFGLDQDIDYSRIRSLATVLPTGQDWRAIDPRDPPEEARGAA
ncbi:MAG TPA: Rieske 2Fe-2S domain-containing protein [Hyphomicrobiales bacterium]|nr:Rieske 2Fe-2S domain-containing protein [Hyphomicrobiales bacterium]